MLWKSPHPDLDIPTDLTTWQWAFEHPQHSPTQYTTRDKLGSYINADTKERLDFAEVQDKATKLSTALIRKYGLQPGETVSLFSTNSIWYPVAMWATVRAGARVNGASPAYNVEEMTYALTTAGSKFVVTLPASLDVALKAARAAGLSRKCVLLLEGRVDGFVSVQQLIEYGSGFSPYPAWIIPEGEDNRTVCGLNTGYLNFSSGTTGLPKAVMLSHHNLIAQCHQLKQLQALSVGQKYRILAVMPLFHITGLVRFCHYPVFMNGNSIMMPSFNMERLLQNIIEYQIEELILVPPIIIRLVKDPIVDRYLDDLRRVVKRWSSGSAPSAPEILQQLQKKFPATGFRQGYGATESTACISAHPPSHFDYKYAHTGGLLVANTVAKVIDIDDPLRELGPGETGEIYAKGPQIAMGYLHNAKASAETFDADGYFHTGDVGHIDAEGLVHIEDRLKEMIKVKGQQVAPAELEDLLLGHEAVEDCAVLGIPDLYAGERPKAYVVLKANVHPDTSIGERLLRFVKNKKVRYKWVAEIEFADSVPKSPTGKLLRRILKVRDRDNGRVKGVIVRDAERERARL